MIKGYKEDLLNFLQDNYFKISATFSIYVVVCYWSFFMLGSRFMKSPTTMLGHIFTIFLHGGELSFIIYDFINVRRNYYPFSGHDLKILTLLYLVYTLLDVIGGRLLDFYPYAFMVNLSVQQLILVYCVLFLVLINCYMLYQYILKVRLNRMEDERSTNNIYLAN